MLDDILQAAVILNILAATIRISTPLLMGAMGELVSERSGIMNLGLEGMMIFGVFTVWLVTVMGGTTVMGGVVALIVGALLGLFLGILVIYLKVDQTVAGLSINLLAVGFGEYFQRMINAGGTEVMVDILPQLSIPFLKDIPILGEVFFQQSIFTYIAFLSVPMIAWFLGRTKYGLTIRSAGENPRAVDTRGINVNRVRLIAITFGGLMAGLGGAFLMSVTSRYLPGMVAGRGWLAIIVVIAGNWKPARMVIATLLFAFLGALQVTLTTFEIAISYELFLVMPYVLALVALALSRVRSAQPAKLAVPYSRE
jgi:simple sugar transport system permease protein|tara:strand:- start:2523 stop:3455 length:933 start_codon:yes stop_codon:yes gene_type:complete